MAESLYERLANNRNSSSPALYYENKRISYPVLLHRVRQMAGWLRRLGVKKGDVVTVSLPNIPACVYALYALNMVGAVQNIIHPLSPVSEVIRTADDTDSALVLLLSTTYRENRDLFRASKRRFAFANPMYEHSLHMRLLCRLKYGAVPESDRIFDLDRFRREAECTECTPPDSASPSVLLHSGGTTGYPKTIELNDDAINSLVAKADDLLPNGMKNRAMLAVLPAFHGFGLGMGIHAPLFWGESCALMTRFSLKKTVRWINEGKINFIIGVPLLYQKLMKEPSFLNARLDRLECAFIGGDNVPQSLITSFNRLMEEKGSPCRMLEGYGLTETVTVCTVNTIANFRAGSVGKPLRGITLSVRDEDEKPLPVGTVGEVYVAGDTLMNGYRNDPEATARTIRSLDGKTWIRTGDLGYLDEDGYLFLKGRKKRVFKVAGINVYPAEVEHIATDLQEDVYDAAFVLFETPKPHTVLFLVRNKHSVKSEEEIRSVLRARLEERLLKYSLPQRIVFLDSFPKTAVGKTDHKAFRDVGEEENA